MHPLLSRPVPDRRTATPAAVPTWALQLALVLSTTTVLSALRLLFPNIYGLSERSGTITAAAVVSGIALAPFLVVLVIRARPEATVLGLLALAAWRLVVQIWPSVPLAFAAVGAVIALVVLATALADPSVGARGKALAFVGGLVLDVTVMRVFDTWDPAWQRTAGAYAVGGLLVGGLAGASWALRHHRPSAPGPLPVAAVAVGGLLTLEVLFLANPAYLAAAAHLTLGTATAVVLAGLAAAAVAVVWAARRSVALVAVAALVGAGLALPTAKGDAATLWVVGAGAGTALLLVRMLSPAAAVDAGHPRRGVRLLAVGWLVPILFTLLYQLHYDRALPLSNRSLTAAAGLLALLAAAVRPEIEVARSRRRRAGRPAALLAVVALLAAAALTGAKAVSPVDRATTPSPVLSTLRVVQWNVHQAVDDDGQLDPATLARAIRGQGPVDVVVLNEVGRGWPLSGQLDLASWLSHRLDLPFVWAGAASASFGNVVLSRLPVDASELLTLPTAPGAQGRSALRLTLATGGAPVHVVATHLQHRNDAKAMAARLRELDWIVERWGGTPRTVLVGDLNPEQGDPPAYPERTPSQFPEIGVLLRAGMTTAADLTSCAAPTSGRNCSDYVFVTGDLHEQALSVVAAGATDHRMLVADISLPAGS